MNKKILIFVVALATLIGSFIVYTNFVKEYELIINKEVISKDTSLKLNKSIDKELKKYQDELIRNSRTTIENIEKKYNEKIDLTKNEKVKVKKISKYEYKIEVSHQVKRTMSEEIAYTSSIVEDPNSYSTYSAVQTAGVNGTETTTYTSTYINGEFITFKNKDVVKVDPIAEITVVGTMPTPGESSTYTSGSSYTAGGTGAVASGSNAGGSTSSGCNDQLNPACGYWMMDYSRCADDAFGTNCPLIWIKY